MPVTIEGNYPVMNRSLTELFSLDMALAQRGEAGLPLRSIIEIYGYPNVGKSTLAYYLAASVAKGSESDIALCDLEMLDRQYITTAVGGCGFEGTVTLIDTTDDKGKPIPHEKMLMQMARLVFDEKYGSSILDSVGMVMPTVEAEGAFGEAFMGKRAKLVAQVSRALMNNLRNKELPSASFIINHVHPNIGKQGHSTAGGETLKFAAQVRLMLWTGEVFADKEGKPYGFYVQGQVEKLRYGGRGRKFGFYIVPGYGVHIGASAMFDCFLQGLAERTQQGRVKIGDKNFGYIGADLLSAAYAGNTRRFSTFEEKIAEHREKVLKGDAQWMNMESASPTDSDTSDTEPTEE